MVVLLINVLIVKLGIIFLIECTQFCPESFYKNNHTLSCQACPTSCKNCLDFSYCQICKTGQLRVTVKILQFVHRLFLAAKTV